MAGNPEGKGGGKRGKVAGWSVASRRRMRAFLLTQAPPDGWVNASATFTIPGPSMDHQRAKAIFADWAQRANLSGWCAVWRLELQTRGMCHWHVLLSVPGDSVRLSNIVESWHDALRRAGPETFDPPYEQGNALFPRVENRMALFGAADHAATAEWDKGGVWHRYISDHASKTKQEQAADGVGRHWGIIGRKRYRPAFPDLVATLTDAEYARLRRAYERLATPSRPAACVFGRKLGWRCKRGRRGAAVCFCRPDTLRRLIEWTVSQPPPHPRPGVSIIYNCARCFDYATLQAWRVENGIEPGG